MQPEGRKKKKFLFDGVKHTFYPIYFLWNAECVPSLLWGVIFADSDTFLFLKLP